MLEGQVVPRRIPTCGGDRNPKSRFLGQHDTLFITFLRPPSLREPVRGDAMVLSMDAGTLRMAREALSVDAIWLNMDAGTPGVARGELSVDVGTVSMAREQPKTVQVHRNMAREGVTKRCERRRIVGIARAGVVAAGRKLFRCLSTSLLCNP